MFLNKKHEAAYEALKNEKYDLAVQRYSECISLNPSAPEYYSERGVAFIHLKDKTRCLQDMDKSVELQPDYAYRYASRGHAKDFFGDTDGAIKDYEKAISLDNKDEILHNNLGVLLEKKGYQDAAQRHFEQSDKIRKAEDALEELVENVEGISMESDTAETFVKAENEKKEENQEEKKSSGMLHEFKKIFTQSEQRKDFLAFLKNGFKVEKKKWPKRKKQNTSLRN